MVDECARHYDGVSPMHFPHSDLWRLALLPDCLGVKWQFKWTEIEGVPIRLWQVPPLGLSVCIGITMGASDEGLPKGLEPCPHPALW